MNVIECLVLFVVYTISGTVTGFMNDTSPTTIQNRTSITTRKLAKCKGRYSIN